MGAASIAKIIAKWVDKGYPEEVAERIAKGELPMDPASVAKRADEQGYGPVLYRGHGTDESSLTFGSPKSDQDMWLTSSPDVAQTYADARPGDGVVTPLRTNADYHGPGNLAYVRGDGKMHDKVTTNSIKNPGIEQGIIKGTDNIAEVVKDSGNYQGTHFRNIKDEFNTKSSTEPSDVYNILGSRPDVNIRHADAAYDPQYTGPNIMGGAALPVAGGLLASGQSEDADASLAKLAARGYRLIEDVQDPKYKYDSLFTVADDAGNEVARAHMVDAAERTEVFPGAINALDLEVLPPYRGNGIAGEMYDSIEETTGKRVRPSNHLTPDGAKFWSKRDRDTIRALLEAGYFDEWDVSGTVREALEGSLFGPVDPSKTVGF